MIPILIYTAKLLLFAVNRNKSQVAILFSIMLGCARILQFVKVCLAFDPH